MGATCKQTQSLACQKRKLNNVFCLYKKKEILAALTIPYKKQIFDLQLNILSTFQNGAQLKKVTFNFPD